MSTLNMVTTTDHNPRITIAADKGGTFCDFYITYFKPKETSRTELILKLLSQDPSNYKDSTREGIRRALLIITGEEYGRDDILPIDKIESIRLSTTVATNALLERQGAKFAMMVTKGFKSLLVISNQTRPKIFDLNIRRAGVLYEKILEVEERITLVGYTSDPKREERAVVFNEEGKVIKGYDDETYAEGEVVRGLSGEAVRILKSINEIQVKRDLQGLFDDGFRSLAIVLMHAFTYPHHEEQIQSLALEIGFQHVSISSQSLPVIRIIPRGSSTSADAYLTPILQTYIDGLFSGFDPSLREHSLKPHIEGEEKTTTVEFMRSDGGLTDVNGFSGLRSILSGPAGGVVGYAATSYAPGGQAIIGFDMGGTSTDVSRFDGEYEIVFESTTAGITVQSPQLSIDTVAAGGGSRLFWRTGIFSVGPESAGSDPGAACYRKGGPATITDANLVLGRLLPEHFPKIFGKTENLHLDIEASKKVLEELMVEINRDTGSEMTLEEVAWGFIKVSNEIMCRPIRGLTEARGYDTSKHILASFGGAGGQSCFSIASTLGIKTILVHRYSSILSAYGMALSERVYEKQEPSSEIWSSSDSISTSSTSSVLSRLVARVEDLSKQVHSELERQGFSSKRIELRPYLNMRYNGTDSPLMVLRPTEKEGGDAFWGEAFAKAYKDEFGFSMTVPIIVDDVRIRGIGKSFDSLGQNVFDEAASLEFNTLSSEVISDGKCTELTKVYYEEIGRIEVPVYFLEKLAAGDKIVGAAIILDGTSTLILDPKSIAKITSRHVIIEL